MKRRDFVALCGALGAGLISVGCQSPASPIAGRIVGASWSVGHRLWQNDFPAPDETRTVGVAILGGGVAGLSAAWKLSRSGIDDIELLELEAETGGNARYVRYPTSMAPWGAHYLPVPTVESRAVRELLQDLEILTFSPAGQPLYDEETLCFAPQERVHIYGRWYDGIFPHTAATPDDMRQLALFNQHVQMWMARRDKQGRKAFAIPVALSSPDWQDLDRESMAAYMSRLGFTSPRLRWYVEYGCRDDYGCSLETTSAWAGLHYFASRDGGGYTDPGADLVWPEGNGFLVRALHKTVTDRVHAGALVYKVASHDKGVTIDYLDVASNRTKRLEASYAVYAMPRFTAAHLLRTPAPDFTYAPWMVANVVVDRPPQDVRGEAGLCWDNILFDSPSLGYVVATHQSLKLQPGGTVMTWYRSYPEPDAAATRRTLLSRPWESYRDEVVAEMIRVHPDMRPHIQQVDIMVWGHGMIRPQPGFLWGAARAAAQHPAGRVHFAHSDMSGISIFEEAQYHGIKAAEDVLTALHHPFTTSL